MESATHEFRPPAAWRWHLHGEVKWRLDFYRPYRKDIVAEPLYPGPRPVVSIKPMQLSDGRTDYFVSIQVGEKDVTPHVFREEFKAAYHVALYDWLLNGVGEEPDCVAFGPNDWPAKKMPAVTSTSDDLINRCNELLANYHGDAMRAFEDRMEEKVGRDYATAAAVEQTKVEAMRELVRLASTK